MLILITSATKGDPFVYDAKSPAVNVLVLRLSASLMKVPTYEICTKETERRAQGGSYPRRFLAVIALLTSTPCPKPSTMWRARTLISDQELSMYRGSSPSSSSGVAAAPRKRNRRNLYNISDMNTVQFPKENEAGPDFERSTLVALMAPSAFQAQLLSSFIQSISSSDPANLVPTLQCYSTWLSSIATSTSVSTTLMWSLRALSLSHLGHQVQDRNLIQNSRAMYGKALLHLNKSLQDPEEGLSTDTLSATALLSFYEILTCTERDAWVQVSCHSLP